MIEFLSFPDQIFSVAANAPYSAKKTHSGRATTALDLLPYRVYITFQMNA